jgi:hypothetical protein
VIIGVVVGVGGFILLSLLVYFLLGYRRKDKGNKKVYVEPSKAETVKADQVDENGKDIY